MEDKENFNSFLHNFSNIVNIDNSTYQTNQTSQKNINLYGSDLDNQDFFNLQVRLQMTEKDLQETKLQIENDSRQRNETFLYNIEKLSQKHQAEVSKLRIEYEKKIDSLIIRHSNEKQEMSLEIDMLRKQVDDLNNEIEKSKAVKLHRVDELVKYQRNYIKELNGIMSDISKYKVKTMKDYDELFCKYQEIKEAKSDRMSSKVKEYGECIDEIQLDKGVFSYSGVDIDKLEEQYKKLMPGIDILEIELKAVKKENQELRKQIILLEEKLNHLYEGPQKRTCRSNGVTTTKDISSDDIIKVNKPIKVLKPSLSELKISNSNLLKESLVKISTMIENPNQVNKLTKPIKEISSRDIMTLVKGLKKKSKVVEMPLQMKQA